MKIIGFLKAWACEDWIEYAIKQSLDLVDELIINISPWNEYFERIEDKTYEKASKYFKNEKIKVIHTKYDKNKPRGGNEAAFLNQMIQASENIEIDNIIWIFDADEYYSRDAVEEVRNYIYKNDFDLIEIYDRFFCINLKYYINISHKRIIKIKTKNLYFTPSQTINPKPVKVVKLLKNNPMFHYSMLTGEQSRIILWILENYYLGSLWYKKIYLNYDPEDEELWMKKNQKLTGIYGFWFQSDVMSEKNNHGLFTFEGKHPEIIENSHLRNISDFRIYMRQKSNYKIYLKVIKKVIAEEKKFDFNKFRREKTFQIMTFLKRNSYFMIVHNKLSNIINKVSFKS